MTSILSRRRDGVQQLLHDLPHLVLHPGDHARGEPLGDAGPRLGMLRRVAEQHLVVKAALEAAEFPLHARREFVVAPRPRRQKYAATVRGSASAALTSS